MIKMITWCLFLVLLQLAAVAVFVECSKEARFNGHRLSLRSIRHLKKMGMDSEEIRNLATTMSFKEKGESIAMNSTAKKTRKCGDALRMLLKYVVDNSDKDGQQMVAAQLDNDKFSIFTGTVAEKEFPVEKLALPIETVDDECFAVRPNNELPTILCTGCLNKRNIWINALHEAALCKKTKIQGRLPELPGPELEAETVTLAEETKTGGVNIHIANSPLGKPEVMINGLTVQQMEEAEKKHAVAEVQVKPPTPSISDIAPKVDNEPEEPENPVNSMNKPRSNEEIEALMESQAEHNSVPASDPRVPKYGYEATKRGLNKHHLNV